jgi:hypothetical protein
MPKKTTKPVKPRRPSPDENTAAKNAVDRLLARHEEREKDPAAVALGRKGGLIGGKRRLETMTPEQRSEVARKAAAVRWGNRG